MTRAIVEVYPSAWFMDADVYVTDCRHRHIAPAGVYHVGDAVWCHFCADGDASIWPDPPDTGMDPRDGPFTGKTITIIASADVGDDVPGGGAD